MGRLVRVGVIDSGINPGHRQVGPVAGGVGIHVRDGELVWDDDWHDRLGHGTAVAATIREYAPEASLYAIRVFRRRLSAHREALLAAFAWAAEQNLDLVCASLGWASSSLERRSDLEKVVAGSVVVAAATVDGAPSVLAEVSGVLRVEADPALGRDELRYQDDVFYASASARALEDLPAGRNLRGTSLAVARVTGRVAALLASGAPFGASAEAVLRASAVR